MHGMRWMASGPAVTAAVVAMLVAGAGTSVAGAAAAISGRQAGAAAMSASRASVRPDVVSFPRLNAVSCPTRSMCLAVGAFGPTHSLTRPYSEIWNGTGWRLLNTAGPAHAHQLGAVSCASRTSCVALGVASFSSPFADAWNGRGWHVLPAPSQQVGLSGISCPTAGKCMAVGNTSGNAAAERWDGTAWHVLTVPAVPGAVSSGLGSVSCVSAASCIAVGSYVSTASGNPKVMLAEAWDGTSWTMLATPAVDPAGSSLSSVSCASATRCVAVGLTGALGSTPVSLLAEGWDGHKWTVLPAVPPGSASSFLSGVSCAGTSCVAVGGHHLPDSSIIGKPGNLAESWNGSTWKITKTPAAFNAGSISCPAAASCMGVGGTLAEQWNGSGWRMLRTLRFDSLASISCTRRNTCVAVGGYVNGSARGLPLAERWNGSRWLVSAPPAPAKFHALSDVSCVSVAFCLAIGTDRVGHSIAEKWNGHRWRLLTAPPGRVTIVSCSSATSCMAMGDQFVGSEVAAVWNGTMWRTLPVPKPKAFSFSLNDLSCPAVTRCIAVGSKSAIGRADHPLAEEWNGRRWQIQPTHLLPPGDLNGVDCTGRSSCMAVGSGLDARWNGRTWKALRTPNSVGLGDVSCVSASDCLAVGSYIPGFGDNPVQVAEHWNGRHWGLVRTPVPGGVLSAVSCARGLTCIAVGQAGGLDTMTLAERWNGVRWRLMNPGNP